MGDSGVGGGIGSAMSSAVLTSLFKPNPNINILKIWEGIVEIALRVASLVLLFILFICTCAALANVNQIIPLNTFTVGLQVSSRSAAGWILFVIFIAAILEGLLLASRFLNFPFVTKYFLIVHVVDISISFGIAVAIFCGAIALGVYSGQWAGITNVVSSTGATAAFGFFTLFVFVGLGVWMIVSLVLKWRNTARYSAPSGGGGDEYAGGEGED